MIKRFFGLLLLFVALYLLVVFEWVYSSGERAGWVQKISRKGWICKTWEGELTMAAIPGSAPEKFTFTVRDDAVAALINQSAGLPVRLHYQQHRGLPGTCFGETGYWVDSLVVVTDRPQMAAPSLSAPNAPAAAPPAAAPSQGSSTPAY
jgi:hypothetical protein